MTNISIINMYFKHVLNEKQQNEIYKLAILANRPKYFYLQFAAVFLYKFMNNISNINHLHQVVLHKTYIILMLDITALVYEW